MRFRPTPSLRWSYRGQLLLLLLSGLVASLPAQPLPCGPEPDMTPTCIDACVICDIDGYTGINDDTVTGQAPDGFCTTVVHHMQWIAFIAGSTNLTITVTPSNCQNGLGLEVGIYESLDCDHFKLVSNCNGDIGPGQTGVFTNTEPLTIGQYYYFVMDGNHGDICEYTIHVTDGSTMVPPLPPAGPVEGPDVICRSDTASYSIPGIEGANFVEWTLNGIPVAEGYEVDLTFPTAGSYELCAYAYNVCDTVAPTCQLIEVVAPATTELLLELCAGECYEVADTSLCDPGDHTFILSSFQGCDSTVHVSISQLPAVTVALEATICSTDSLWVGGRWFYPPGEYTEILTAHNGCDSIIQLTLHEIICEITGITQAQPVVCYGESSGQLTFAVSNGSPPFSYAWERLGGMPSGVGTVASLLSPTTLTDLPPGTYLITVNDTYGNDVVLMGTITEPPPLTLTPELLDYNGYQLSCAGASDGMVTLLAQGGSPAYQFSWSTGASQQMVEGLPAGSYSATVTDAGGCSMMAEVELVAPPPLEALVWFTDPGCEGYDSGEISVASMTGGVGPYLAALSEGAFTAETTFAGLTGGQYTLTIMDANGCTTDTSATLTAAFIPTLELGEDIAIDLGYSERLQVYVDIYPDSINWSPAIGLSCTDCLEPVAGPWITTVYTLTVTSVNGCPATDSLTVYVLNQHRVYAPNAFSPNGDGANDRFTIFGDDGLLQVKNLKVFSRWGELLFDQSDFPAN
ncbi:MAG: gliding motility-associated C-terminal domain-containing protein, partial [Lewinella sp.]|nr:gliding motility-associated C-terminal domain-containing protein [Lewinella sp.]